jgi:hypothetical protein
MDDYESQIPNSKSKVNPNSLTNFGWAGLLKMGFEVLPESHLTNSIFRWYSQIPKQLYWYLLGFCVYLVVLVSICSIGISQKHQ